MSELASELSVIRSLLSGRLRLIRCDVAEEGVTATLEDEKGQACMVLLSVLASTIPLEERPPAPAVRFDSQPHWTVGDLAMRDLPRWWNRQDLVNVLASHRNSLGAAAQELGTTVAELKEFKATHEIGNARYEWIIRTYEQGDYASQEEFARIHGQSGSVVSTLVGKLGGNKKAIWQSDHKGHVKALISIGAGDLEIRDVLRALDVTQSDRKVQTYINRLRQEVSRGG